MGKAIFLRLDEAFFESTPKRKFSFAEADLYLIYSAWHNKLPYNKVIDANRTITINQGEIHANTRYLAKMWGWAYSTVKWFINLEISNKRLSRRVEQGESILKVCEYDKYIKRIQFR